MGGALAGDGWLARDDGKGNGLLGQDQLALGGLSQAVGLLLVVYEYFQSTAEQRPAVDTLWLNLLRR